jgi:hypothetical protein
MKKLILLLTSLFIFFPLSSAQSAESIVRITSVAHQSFTGEFRNDDLAEELKPTGALGALIYTPNVKNKIWVIDSALIDEVTNMTSDYKLVSNEDGVGSVVAVAWLKQLARVTTGQQVVALAYGNPDVSLAKKLAPSELRNYFAVGQARLQAALGRPVRSEPNGGWSTGKSKVSNELIRAYSDNRKALTRLSQVVDDEQLQSLRTQLSKLLSPQLDNQGRKFYFQSANSAVNTMIDKLRINSGNYQITTSNVKLPVTVINEFNSDVTVNIKMSPTNSRVTVGSFENITIPARSKKQLELNVAVIAPGQTTVLALITNNKGGEVVPEAILSLNSTVIDPRVIWLTTGAAILLLLAAVAQSLRRVRKRNK